MEPVVRRWELARWSLVSFVSEQSASQVSNQQQDNECGDELTCAAPHDQVPPPPRSLVLFDRAHCTEASGEELSGPLVPEQAAGDCRALAPRRTARDCRGLCSTLPSGPSSVLNVELTGAAFTI